MDRSSGAAVTDPTGGTVISASNSKKIDCAKAGIRELLSGLLPCNTNLQTCGTAPPLDQVGLMVYPPLKAPDAPTHDNNGDLAHSNINLETSSSCSGELNNNPRPSWYTPSQAFPNWFIQWPNDVSYGTPGAAAVAAVDEVDRLTVNGNPAANTNQNPSFFTVTVNGQTTGNIIWPTTGATIEAAIVALSNVDPGDVAASPATNNAPWTITFANGLGSQNVAFSRTDNLRGGNASITSSEVLAGSPGSSATQQVDADYTFAPLSNDFRTSADPGLNANSRLTQSITWASCLKNGGGTTTVGTQKIASETTKGYPGNQYYGINALGNTYFTGALLAAQKALAAEAAKFPQRDAQPVIIFLSDGEANYFAKNPCSTAISASQAAAQAGTWVYSIAYKIQNLNCTNPDGSNEAPSIDSYTTMSQIARNSDSPTVPDSSKFFCPGSSFSGCGSGSSLTQVFKSIGTQLTASRLYSDDTFN